MNERRNPVGGEELATLAHPKAVGTLAGTAFDFEVVDGPDSGKRFTIDASSPMRVLVGQSQVCDFVLTDRAVSRRHVALELSERGVRLSDLSSTNGTFVSGLAVVQMFLHGGETVRLGGTTLQVSARKADAQRELPSANGFGKLVGSSFEMRRLYPMFERLAQSNLHAIIEGESGTGKDMLAESIHEQGPRASAPFVVFECRTTPSAADIELFGQESGGVVRAGALEQAAGGTLVLDHVSDLDIAIQPKLVRAIERGEFRRVGGDTPIKFDARILATTRRDLDGEVLAGRFREDLFRVIAGARVELPPLRNRRGDVAILVQHFAKQLGADDAMIASRIMRKLRTWEEEHWSGNVRELRNAVARQLALGDLDEFSIPPQSSNGTAVDPMQHILGLKLPFSRAREMVLEEFRRRYVERVLAEQGGNVMRAAAASGIGRRYFQRIKARQRDAGGTGPGSGRGGA